MSGAKTFGEYHSSCSAMLPGSFPRPGKFGPVRRCGGVNSTTYQWASLHYSRSPGLKALLEKLVPPIPAKAAKGH